MTNNMAILLVDDDQVDVFAVREALEADKIGPVCVARDGLEALEILKKTRQNNLPAPFIILLDLNMPRMGGIEFLRELRRDSLLRRNIVFVLTTSNDDRDRMNAYEYNVAGYITKSSLGDNFQELTSLLRNYRSIVQFPLWRCSGS